MKKPFLDGLATGLAQPSDTLSISDATLIAIGAKIDRLSEATERQATALENLSGLFAAVIGLADSQCPDEVEGGTKYKPVAFVRSGNGMKLFTCDAEAGPV